MFQFNIESILFPPKTIDNLFALISRSFFLFCLFYHPLSCAHERDSDSQKIIENGIITQMRAEWVLPEDKKLEVTLKELKQDKFLTVSDFFSVVRRRMCFASDMQYVFNEL